LAKISRNPQFNLFAFASQASICALETQGMAR
jgi:hypothetical protein